MANVGRVKALARRALGATLLVTTIALVLVYYLFQVTAGHFDSWHVYTDYYERLSAGFADGHLYLATRPSPRLLAAANPFDRRYRGLWIWDASLYHQHFYLYWGPVPAIIGALFKLWKRTVEIGDAQLTFWFMVGRFMAGSALLWLLPRRVGLSPPFWAVLVAIAVFGLSSPTPFFLARGAVYEAAIAGGQCFLTLGWLFALLGLQGHRQTVWLALASASWGLAVGCRVSLLPCVAATVLMSWLAVARIQGLGFRAQLRPVLALGLPLASAVAGLASYNYARFQDVLEFGTTHQLTWMNFWTDRHFVMSNVYAYLLRPLQATCAFPYFTAPWNLGQQSLPHWLHPDARYSVGEPVAGILLSTPYAWLAPGLLLTSTARLHPRERWSLRWVAWVCVLTIVLGLAPALGLWMATMRYLSDVAAAVALLGTLGGWSLLARTQGKRLHVAAALAYSIAALASIGLAVLLGFQGYLDHFRTNNPALVQKLTASLSSCRGAGR